jgi:antitoxin PrlF
MAASTLTSKGQITIPKEIRDALGLKEGHRLTFRVREDGIVEMRPDEVDLMSLCGSIRPKTRGVTVEDMNEAIRKAAIRK